MDTKDAQPEGYAEALAEAKRFETEKKNQDELFYELGLRREDEKNPGGQERSLQFTADFQEDASDLGSDTLKRIGEQWWKNIEKEVWNLVCKADDPELKSLLNNRSLPEAAAVLATGALSTLGPPSWVIVVALIVVRKLVKTGLDALCAEWNPMAAPS